MDEMMDKDVISLLDEEGNEHEMEIIDSLEMDNKQYLALIPVFDDANEELEDSGELVILRVSEEQDESGEEFLDAIEDEAEYDKVAAEFMKRLEEDYDFEEVDE